MNTTEQASTKWRVSGLFPEVTIRVKDPRNNDDLAKIADINPGRMDYLEKANLIASAPQLLEACKSALNALEDSLCGLQPDTQVLLQIQSAIINATKFPNSK